jgi:hypothetical protein
MVRALEEDLASQREEYEAGSRSSVDTAVAEPAWFFGEDREFAPTALNLQERLAEGIEYEVTVATGAGLSCQAGAMVPGYYRPEVRWSVGAYSGGVLTAVAWQVTDSWPYLARNFHLMIAEAVSSAVELQQAFQAGLLGETKPLACCFFCIHDCQGSRLTGPGPVSGGDEQSIAGKSYLDTYLACCRRLLSSGLYDTACFTTYDASSGNAQLSYPVAELSLTPFLAKIGEHATRQTR